MFHYQNTRGLKTKLSNLRLSLEAAFYDVIILTEKWLDDSIPSSLFCDRKYTVYHCDRSSVNSTCSRGGGVLITFSAKLSSLHIEVSQCSLELLWIQIKLNSHSLFVGGVYLTPNLSPNTDTLDSLFNTIKLIQYRMKDRDLFVLSGDFNQPGLSWSQNKDYFAPLAVNPASSYFLDGLAEFNLRQLSGVANFFRTH